MIDTARTTYLQYTAKTSLLHQAMSMSKLQVCIFSRGALKFSAADAENGVIGILPIRGKSSAPKTQ